MSAPVKIGGYTMPILETLMDWALFWASQGIPVFPYTKSMTAFAHAPARAVAGAASTSAARLASRKVNTRAGTATIC
jgi:hypothetical protein